MPGLLATRRHGRCDEGVRGEAELRQLPQRPLLALRRVGEDAEPLAGRRKPRHQGRRTLECRGAVVHHAELVEDEAIVHVGELLPARRGWRHRLQWRVATRVLSNSEGAPGSVRAANLLMPRRLSKDSRMRSSRQAQGFPLEFPLIRGAVLANVAPPTSERRTRHSARSRRRSAWWSRREQPGGRVRWRAVYLVATLELVRHEARSSARCCVRRRSARRSAAKHCGRLCAAGARLSTTS
eukprot:scaffold77621_cov65-Phaeocystis_antarctica.AAC.5